MRNSAKKKKTIFEDKLEFLQSVEAKGKEDGFDFPVCYI